MVVHVPGIKNVMPAIEIDGIAYPICSYSGPIMQFKDCLLDEKRYREYLCRLGKNEGEVQEKVWKLLNLSL